MGNPRLLIVEDEIIIAMNIQKILEGLGFEVLDIVAKGEDAVARALEERPDLVLMDIILAGEMDGIEAARKILEHADIPIMYLTANADRDTVMRARDTAPYGYLNKPINQRDLYSNLDSALYKHRLNKRLRESEEKYRGLIDDINDVVFSADENGIVTFISHQVADFLGYSEHEIIGRPINDFTAAEDHLLMKESYEKYKKGVALAGQFRVVSREGKIIWVRSSSRPVFIGGRFNGIKGIIADITESKIAEEALQKKNEEIEAANEELQAMIDELESTNEEFEAQNSEFIRANHELERSSALMDSIFSSAQVGIGVLVGRVFQRTNRMLREMTGYGEDEIHGFDATKLSPSKRDFNLISREIRDQLEKNGTAMVETRWKRKNGTIIDVLLGFAPIDPHIIKAGVTITALDITEQKQIEASLKTAQRDWEEIFQAIGHPTLILDKRHRIIDLNREVEKASSISKDDLIGKHCFEFFHKGSRAPAGCPLKRLLKSGEIGTIEMEMEAFNGIFLVSCTPVVNNRGEVERIIHIATDITELKRAEKALKDQEEKYRLLAENISDNIWIMDVETLKFPYTSPPVEKLLGYTEEEIHDLSITDIVTPKSLDMALNVLIEEVARDRKRGVDPDRSRVLEVEQIHKDGRKIWVEMTVRFLRDEKGKIRSILGVSRDITERKQTEEALHKSEERYKMLVENSSDIIFSGDLSGKINFVNKAFEEILGYKLDRSSVINPFNLIHPDDIESAKNELRKAVQGAGVRNYGFRCRTSDGIYVHLMVNADPLYDDKGTIIGIKGICRDITALKLAEDLTRLQRDLAQKLSVTTSLAETLRLCLDAAISASGMDSGGIYLLDEETKGLRLVHSAGLSESFIKDVAYFDRDSKNARLVMKGKPLYNLYSKIPTLKNAIQKIEDIKAIAVIPIMNKGRVMGSMNIASHVLGTIPGTTRNVLEGIASQIGDVLARLEMQDLIVRNEGLFRKMIESAPYPIHIINSDGTLDYVNKKSAETFGYTLEDMENVDEIWRLIIPDEKHRKKARRFWEDAVAEAKERSSDIGPFEINIVDSFGEKRQVEFRMVLVGDKSVIIMNDLTQWKKTQEMMIQTEKMMSIGGLAAGMAHEINNPLGIILHGIQAAMSRISPDVEKNREAASALGTTIDAVRNYLDKRDVIEYLEGMQEAGVRAAKIVSNMLQFSRNDNLKKAVVDINRLIDNSIEMASNDYDLKKKYDFRKIAITRKFGRAIPKILCSETGIEQVILNLLKNSSQALAEVKDTGFRPEITVRTFREYNNAVIEVSDNGPGIEEDVIRHVFEPFFTTKGVGIGTGLGLSVSYFIITNNHNGTITVESEPGMGAVFTIRLPLGEA